MDGVGREDLTQERGKEREGWMGYGIPFLFGKAEESKLVLSPDFYCGFTGTHKGNVMILCCGS